MIKSGYELQTDSVWIRILPFPFLPHLNTRALSPFSLITQQVEKTYQNSKSFIKRNRSITLKLQKVLLAPSIHEHALKDFATLSVQVVCFLKNLSEISTRSSWFAQK